MYISRNSVIEPSPKILLQIMFSAMCRNHKAKAFNILALKESSLAEDRFGTNQRYREVFWEHNRGRNAVLSMGATFLEGGG